MRCSWLWEKLCKTEHRWCWVNNKKHSSHVQLSIDQSQHPKIKQHWLWGDDAASLMPEKKSRGIRFNRLGLVFPFLCVFDDYLSRLHLLCILWLFSLIKTWEFLKRAQKILLGFSQTCTSQQWLCFLCSTSAPWWLIYVDINTRIWIWAGQQKSVLLHVSESRLWFSLCSVFLWCFLWALFLVFWFSFQSSELDSVGFSSLHLDVLRCPGLSPGLGHTCLLVIIHLLSLNNRPSIWSSPFTSFIELFL